MLRYCGDNVKVKHNVEELGFIANDYALVIYQEYFRELPTGTQIKILERISGDYRESEKIRSAANKLIWRIRVKIEEELLEAEK